jgi:NTE family protein
MKKCISNYKCSIFFILYLLFFATWVFPQESKPPKIALVLSGGGAKGFAHIGVLKVLEAEGIPIDMVVGTSMGSIVGGLYSIGYCADEIEQMAKSQDWGLLLSDDLPRNQLSQITKTEKQRFVLSVPVHNRKRPTVPLGAIQGQNLINLFCDLAGNVPVNADFRNFPIDYACIGTDLETGNEIIIDSGFFPTALFSSMAIPGVYYPGEHNGHVMIDGGMANNFATDLAKAMGADIIIGVDIRSDLRSTEDINSLQHLIDQLINFYSVEKDSIRKSYCTVLIRPDITGYSALSFNSKAIDTLVKRGIQSAQMVVPELKKLKTTYNLSPRETSRNFIKLDKWPVAEITLSGDYSVNDKLILDKINLAVPGNYTYEDIKGAIDRIYGLGCIKRAYFNLADGEKGKTLNFHIEEEMVSNINIGMRVNTADAVSILINYTQRDFRRYFGMFSVAAEISSNPGFNIFGEISKGKLPVIGLQLEGKYRNYNIYTDGQKTNSAEIYYGAACLYGYQLIKKHTSVGMGVKQELFNGQIFSATSDSIINSAGGNTTHSNLYAYCSFDNLDNFYFPTKGIEFYSEVSVTDEGKLNKIDPVALLKMRNIVKLDNEYSFLFNLYGRAIFTKTIHEYKLNYVGGHDYEITMSNHLPFYGIPAIMPSERFSFISLAGLRLKIAKKHYITALTNLLLQSDELLESQLYDPVWGFGMGYSYNSRVGPIDLTVGYSYWLKKPTISVNIGLWF